MSHYHQAQSTRPNGMKDELDELGRKGNHRFGFLIRAVYFLRKKITPAKENYNNLAWLLAVGLEAGASLY